jgi:alcohol dehydrogenase (NADP+)
MEGLMEHGKCRAIGLSDITLNGLLPIYESARIKPAVVQVEAHPYLPETELLEFSKEKGVVFLAFAPLAHGMRPGLLEDPVIWGIAARVGKTPAQVLLAWAVPRGTALLTTPRSAARARENFDISTLAEDALDEINRIQTRQRPGSNVKRILGNGDLWITEYRITYQGKVAYAVSIMEFRNSKVVHET